MRTLLACTLALAAMPALATDWTYRGRLTDQGVPANGLYDLEITMYDSERGGLPVSAPIVLSGINVTDGAFAAPLMLEASTRGTRWLAVAVRPSGDKAGFEPLPTREKAVLTPDAFCTGTWDIAGNAGNPVGSFLGTSDNVVLQLRANNTVLGTIKGAPGANSTAFGTNVAAAGVNAAVGGGVGNSASGNQATVAGGNLNNANNVSATIGGGFQNVATSFATVGGGDTNNATGDSSVIGGGSVNVASGQNATVAGGSGNKAQGQYGVVGGGQNNTASNVVGATVCGGVGNKAQAANTVVAGGDTNTAGFDHGAITGGSGNSVTSAYGFVGGGFDNQAGGFAAIGSGDTNVAAGDSSFIGSGILNSAPGGQSVVPGGSQNVAGGDKSFAGGFRAKVRTAAQSADANGDEGSFVWADATAADFSTTGPNQFRVRAGGGVALNSAGAIGPAADLIVGARASGDADSDVIFITASAKSGDIYFRDLDASFHLSADPTGANFLVATNGAVLTTGGVWTNASSREWKHGFKPLDQGSVLEQVLAMPVTEWSYNLEGDVRHVGPIAEDFYQAFGLGADDQHITTVDASGIALAAIQGLARKVEAENAELRAENAELRGEVTRLGALERQVAALSARLDSVAGAAAQSDAH